MKMKPEHYKILEAAIHKFLKPRSFLKESYQKRGLSKTRFVWDIFFASVDIPFIQGVLYKYLNDDHIQTALFKIIGEY